MFYSEGREIENIARACDRAVDNGYTVEECHKLLRTIAAQLRDLLHLSAHQAEAPNKLVMAPNPPCPDKDREVSSGLPRDPWGYGAFLRTH